MSYFSDDDWNSMLYEVSLSLKTVEEVQHANKGQLFEFVVEQVLCYLFRDINIRFTATTMTYDGSKDFWGLDEDNQLWWAECKNYTKNISLIQLAPTLFMADLQEAKYLIFFSHSCLNLNLKRKIGLYADKHRKDVYIYEDNCLDKLILRIFPGVEKFIKKEKLLKQPNDLPLDVQFFNEKNARFFGTDNFDGYYDIKELHVNEIYNLNALILNNDLDQEYLINYTLKVDENFYYYEVLSEEYSGLFLNKKIHKRIKPCQMILVSFPIKLIKRANRLKLPQILVEVNKQFNNNSAFIKTPTSRSYPCIQDRVDIIIGNHYERLISKLEQKCINNSNFSAGLLYGASGTGKTRILTECYSLLVRNNYNVLNFIGFDANDDWKNVLKEIIYNVFTIQDDMILDLLCTSLSGSKDTMPLELTKQQFLILNFLKSLDKREIEIEEIRPFLHILFEKMRSNKIGLIIDNMQAYSAQIVNFFKEMIEYYLSSNRVSNMCVFFSINTESIFDNVFSSFIGLFLSYRNNPLITTICCEEVLGFSNQEQAIVFLQTRLGVQFSSFYWPRLYRLVSAMALRPKYLDIIASYLANSNAICTESNGKNTLNERKFVELLEYMPDELYILFQNSCQCVIKNYTDYKENDYIKVIATVYVKGVVPISIIDKYGLNIELFRILNKHGFLKRECDGHIEQFSFEHDLIEKNFKIIYPNLIQVYSEMVISKPYIIRELKASRLWEYNLILLSNNQATSFDIDNIIKKNTYKLTPNRLQYELMEDMLNNLVRLQKSFSNDDFINHCCSCCIYIRDHLSEQLAASMFDYAFESISSIEYTTPSELKELFSFITHMAENRIRMHDTHKARDLYNFYLHMANYVYIAHPQIELKINYTKSYLYNRRFVCDRIDEITTMPNANWVKAQSIAFRNGFHDILFENLCDLATLFRNQPNSQEKTIKILENAFLHYSQMTETQKNKFWVNYQSNKIRYLCMNSKLEDAFSETENSLTLLENDNNLNDYKLFFRSRFLQCKILISLAMKKTDIDFTSLLEDYRLTKTLLGQDSSFEIAYYKAKCSFLMNNIASYAESLNTLISMLPSFTPCPYHITVLIENLIIGYRQLCRNREYNINLVFLPSKARVILNMSRREFDLFFLQYKCDAPILVANGKNGFHFL